MNRVHRRSLAMLAYLVWSTCIEASASECFGTVSNGRLHDGVSLPLDGANFSAYSNLAAPLGRNIVHGRVADIVLDAYARLAQQDPNLRFVYGETGGRGGGPFKPHKTHQNGLSVDFFMPIRDHAGRSVPLPTHVGNRFGYDIEFDGKGSNGTLQIDFTAIAEHLYHLHAAARQRGVGISLVIVDPRYLPRLFSTPRGAWLKRNLRFLQRDAWVRHDEHYHVDFNLPCKPLPVSSVRRTLLLQLGTLGMRQRVLPRARPSGG